MPTHFWRVARTALTIVRLLTLTLLVGLTVLLLAGTLPSLLGYESFVVPTPMMQPAMYSGDLAVVQPVRADQLQVRDVITYRMPYNPDSVLTRRVLFIDTETPSQLGLQTRGDAEAAAEQISVPRAMLIGRIAYTIPRLGVLVDMM